MRHRAFPRSLFRARHPKQARNAKARATQSEQTRKAGKKPKNKRDTRNSRNNAGKKAAIAKKGACGSFFCDYSANRARVSAICFSTDATEVPPSLMRFSTHAVRSIAR